MSTRRLPLLPIFGLIAGLVFSVPLLSAIAAPPAAPTETRLVDYFEQLGIDTRPRFGWVVNDPDRGERQTAYQIIVAANAADLTGKHGPLWDSGKVKSARQFGVTYAGAPLAKTTRYWWKVRTWDKDDHASRWSEPTSFGTGFFKPSDWSAQWIQHPNATSEMPVMLRKTFPVSKPVTQAYLYVTGLGQFVASLNGRKVGNHVIDPAWTDYDRTVNYVTFDVTSQLIRGRNALGIMLGSGWLNATDNLGIRRFGPMRAIAQLHLRYADGSSADVVSDPTWKADTSPFTYTEMHGVENYDARLDQAGWNTAAFNDSAWVNAVAATPPSGVLSAQSAPPVLAPEVRVGKNISSPSANNSVFDFGKNINAQFEIKVSGKAGAKVTLTPGEHLNGDGTVNPGRSNHMTYTLKGGGPEVWRQTFSTVGMRYVQVGGASTDAAQSDLPVIQSVTGYFTYTGADDVGRFHTSDERYNKIYDLALNALRSNLTSLHTDGPNLEKLGWQEVAWTTLPSSVYQNDEYTLFAKIMRDVREAQRTNGLCSTIAPNYFYVPSTPSKGMYDDAPAWGASIFNAPWQLYQTYGDTKILADNYDAMARYLAYLKGRESNGLITYDGLGDWMAPGGRMVHNVEGAVYVQDTRVMRDVATALGRATDAQFYTGEFTRVRDAYNAAYFDAAQGRYTPVSQDNEAIPLEFGIVPPGREQDVAHALIQDIAQPTETTAENGQNGVVVPGHITAGDIGTTFLWRALGDAGQPDLVQSMIMQPTPPSYLAMINAGETSMAENWNLSNIRSHNHDMYCGIFEWLYRTLGGISPLAPGYAQILLKPGMPSGLVSLAASYDSVRGPIGSAWVVQGNHITWNVRIPANATARVCVPTEGTPLSALRIKEGATLIYANGKAAGSTPGLVYDRIEGSRDKTYAVWNAGSGDYRFTWQVAPVPKK